MIDRPRLSKVRLAVSADLPVLRRLYCLVDREHAEFEPSLTHHRGTPEREQNLRAALGDSAARLTVVTSEANQVVGFAMSSFRRDRPDVVIEAIVVDPYFRKRGHGRALVEDIRTWMETKRGRYLELDVYDFNADAVAFYESLGFITYSRRMRASRPLG